MTYDRYRSVLRDSIVVSISACHADDPGSIPGRGVLCAIKLSHADLLRAFAFLFFYQGPVAQWIRHRSTEPEIVGSSPTRFIITSHSPPCVVLRTSSVWI